MLSCGQGVFLDPCLNLDGFFNLPVTLLQNKSGFCCKQVFKCSVNKPLLVYNLDACNASKGLISAFGTLLLYIGWPL